MIKYICIEDYNRYGVIFIKDEIYSIEDAETPNTYYDVRIYYKSVSMGVFTGKIISLFKPLAEYREEQINEICK